MLLFNSIIRSFTAVLWIGVQMLFYFESQTLLLRGRGGQLEDCSVLA
jgi:hypothetical protein